MKKTYPRIDTFRVVCACLVVLIHCLKVKAGHPYAHMIVSCFAKQAVPFFFIVSGFFFTKKMNKSDNIKKYVTTYAKNQLMIYGAWTLIRLPEMIYFYFGLYKDKSILYMIAIILRRIFFAGYDVYWYLLALSEAILVIGMLIQLNKRKLLYIIAAMGLVLGLLFDAQISFSILGKINQLTDIIFSGSNNFIMKGIPYVTIGVFFAENLEKLSIDRKNKKIAYGYLLVCIVNVLCFLWIYKRNIELERFMCFYVVQAILMFLLAVSSVTKKYEEKICRELRGISATFYYLHTIFIYNFIDVIWTVYAPVMMKFIIATSMCLIVYLIVRKTKCRYMYWLLSIK